GPSAPRRAGTGRSPSRRRRRSQRTHLRFDRRAPDDDRGRVVQGEFGQVRAVCLVGGEVENHLAGDVVDLPQLADHGGLHPGIREQPGELDGAADLRAGQELRLDGVMRFGPHWSISLMWAVTAARPPPATMAWTTRLARSRLDGSANDVMTRSYPALCSAAS